MTFDMFESGGLDTVKFDLSGKMTSLHRGFESSIGATYDAFMDIPESVDGNVAHWLGIDTADAAADLAAIRTEVMASAQQMYNGITYEDGFKTLGLKKFSPTCSAVLKIIALNSTNFLKLFSLAILSLFQS